MDEKENTTIELEIAMAMKRAIERTNAEYAAKEAAKKEQWAKKQAEWKERLDREKDPKYIQEKRDELQWRIFLGKDYKEITGGKNNDC